MSATPASGPGASADDDGFQISPQQRRLWSRWTSRGSWAPPATLVAETGARPDPDRLSAAVAAVADRHEILRTTCVEREWLGEPVQVVSPSEPVLDVSAEALPDGRGRVRFRLPALSADARTLELLAAEVFAIYGGSVPAEPSIQYADISGWLSDLSDDDHDAEPALAYWAGAAHSAVGSGVIAGFGVLGSEPPRITAEPRVVTLDSTTTGRLTAQAGRLGLDASAAVRAALLIALWRRSGGRTITTAEVLSGRTYPDLEPVWGPIARHVPVTTKLDPRESVWSLVERAARACADAAEWQDYFDWRRYTPAPPALAGQHVVAVAFEALGPPPPLTVDGAPGEMVERTAHVDRFAVKVVAEPTGDGLLVRVFHDETSVTDHDVGQLATMLGTILTDMAVGTVADRSPIVAEIAYTSTAEADRALALGRGRAVDHPMLTIPELLSRQAVSTPDRVAVVVGETSLTFDELDRRTSEMARGLQALDVAIGDRVAVLMQPAPDLLPVLFGVQRTGAAYVPLDPSAPAQRMAAVAADAGATLLVADPELVDPWMAASAMEVVHPERLRHLGTQWQPAAALPAIHPGDAAYVIYTSGSTGAPKGVVVEHGNVTAFHQAMREAIPALAGGPLTVLQNAPFTFDASVQQLVLLLDGHTVHLVSDATRRDDQLVLAYLDQHTIDLVNGTPTQIEMLVSGGLLTRDESRELIVLIAGEELRPDLWRRLAATPSIRAYNIYGPTEATVNATLGPVTPSRPVSIGMPLPGYRVHVLDEQLNPVAVGCPGELCIGGPGVSRGYLGQPGLTAERFVPDPWGRPGGRLYRTGDVARQLPSGEIEFMGRADSQVKIRGFRVELAEVEATLAGYGDVGQAVVTTWTDLAGSTELVAYCTVETGGAGSGADIRRYLAERLPPYMVPAAIVILDRLPQLSTGKTDRAALPSPRGHGRAEGDDAAPPRTPAEEVLVAIWSSVLGRDKIGIDDNFFALGGDSIRSLRVRSLAAERGLPVNVQQLYTHQTIRALASAIRADAEPLAPVQPFGLLSGPVRRLAEDPALVDAYPLSARQRTVASHVLLHGSHLYQPYRILELEGTFDATALQRATQAIVDRHPILRSTIVVHDGAPLNLVHRTRSPLVRVIDLEHLDPSDRSATIADAVHAEAIAPFDRASEAPVRLTVYLRDATHFDLAVVLTETAFDGWSVALFLSELLTAYVAHLGGSPEPTPPTPGATHADLVGAEITALSDPVIGSQWRRWLGSGRRQLLAPDEDAGQNEHVVPISDTLASRVTAASRRLAVPVKSLLLAVHIRTLATVAGSDDIVTGLVMNGRPELPDADRIIGQFLNRLPFRMQLPGDGSWSSLVKQVFEHEGRLQALRWYPSAAIEADLGSSLFDTVFNYTHFHVYAGMRSSRLRLVDDHFGKETDRGLLVDFSTSPDSGAIRLSLTGGALTAETLAEIGGELGRTLVQVCDAVEQEAAPMTSAGAVS